MNNNRKRDGQSTGHLLGKRIGFLLLFAILMYLFFYLYYRQIQGGGIYHSDLPAHIAAALNREGYSMLSIIYYIVKDIRLLAVILAAVSASLPFIIMLVLKNGLEKRECFFSWRILFFCGICLTFLAEIYIPVLAPFFYSFTTVTQPWHNQTYIFMKIFSLGVLMIYEKINKCYTEKIGGKDWIIFAILLTITNAIKPNFILFFAPMMLIYLIADFIREKGKNVIQCIKFGSAVLVSLAICLYQSQVLFPSDGDSGAIISFELLKQIISSPQLIWINIVCILFPICVLTLSVKQKMIRKNGMLIKAWIMYFIAWMEARCICETGPRANDGNFGWGMLAAGWILYIYSCREALEVFYKRREKFSVADWILGVLSLVFLILSAISGLVYFSILLRGDSYFC